MLGSVNGCRCSGRVVFRFGCRRGKDERVFPATCVQVCVSAGTHGCRGVHVCAQVHMCVEGCTGACVHRWVCTKVYMGL